MHERRSASPKFIALLLIALIAAPPASFARYRPSTGANSYSVEQEIQIGQQAAAQTMQKMPILPENNPVSQYIAHLGQELAAHAPGYKWPYSYHVVNTKDINAFALPGGPVFINLGTIQAADTEAQLAGVLAHETSHVVERHATRAATKEAKYQVGLGILGALLGGRGIGGALAAEGAKFAVGSYFLHNSRENEQEADLVGTDIMYDTGFNPEGMAEFFQKLEKMGGGGQGVPQFLSDHPDPGNRYAAVEQEISTLPPKSDYRPDSAEFRRIKQLVATMHPPSGQSAAPGAAQTNGDRSGQAGVMAPSGSFQQMQHNNYTLDYPSNWQVLGDAQSDVTIAPQGGVGRDQNGQGAVAYGVIVSTFDGGQRGAASGLDEDTRQLIDQLRQGNPQMRQAGSAENIRVNGVPGKSIEFTGNSPIQGQKERDWLVTVQRPDGTISYLVFIAPAHDFNALRPTFEQMLRSFRVR